MNVLVTGATGFLGSHLAKALLREGYQVTILKRSFSNTSRIEDILPYIDAYDLDRCDLQQPFKDVKIDIVIHTATCYGRKNEEVSTILDANILFPIKLLETAVSNGVNAFLNTDTFFTKFPDYKYLGKYILTKKHFFEWGKFFSFETKLHFLNIKLEHLYGLDDDDSKFTNYIINNCLDNTPEIKLSKGQQKRDFIYIDDVISAYCTIIEKSNCLNDRFQEYELGSGTSTSIHDFAELVRQITNSKTIFKYGALPYRENEIMDSKANLDSLNKLGWNVKINLKDGIKLIVENKKNK
jgi:Nucleoside-diphosphate-sugar epimerases